METSNLSPEQKEQARHGGRLFPLKKYVTKLTDLHVLRFFKSVLFL